MGAGCYILAGGGTGGHLMPGLAVAEALASQEPGSRIVFLCSPRPLDASILSPAGWRFHPLSVEPWPSSVLRWPRFVVRWIRSRHEARELLRALKPRVVLGLGGFAAGPTIVEATRAGIRCGLLNPDARVGRANRYLARRAERIFVQWPVALDSLPDPGRAVVTGCPVRRSFREVDTQAARRRLGLDPVRPLLVATGASQGARTINDTLIEAWPWFARQHPDWQLLHLTGPAEADRVRQAYVQARVEARVQGFSHAMHEVLAAADVVISRAGASTLAELTVLGRPSVLMPYPWHRDRHQHANATQLVEGGAAVCIEDRCDAEANARALLAMLERLCDESIRRAMARMARRLARPDAAECVARWLIAGHEHAAGPETQPAAQADAAAR